MINKPREIALKTIYKINQEQAYSNLALDEEIKQNRKILNEKDIGLISEITYGVTTWKLTLDTIIKKHSKIKLKKNITMDYKHTKNGNIPNYILRQNTKISSCQ